VRVHTVAIGSAGEEVAMDTESGVRRGLHFERHDVDVESLRSVADETGGRFHLARRGEDLSAVYEEIDALERIARPLPPQVRHSERPEPLLAAAAGFLLVELAAARVVRRRLW
jgi:Ca-activated chloride channel family protein